MPEALLDQMARTSRDRANEALTVRTLGQWRTLALSKAKPPTLRMSPFDLIAECKLRAPSSGRLVAEDVGPEHVADRASVYEAAGAMAISVLTEPLRFDGCLTHLRAAARRVSIPVMRKDFLVDPVQIWEAREAGAGGVLLIARMLDDLTMASMLTSARDAELFVLLEAFDDADLVRCAQLTRDWKDKLTLLVGINTRDLQTLEVVPKRLANLAVMLPPGVRWVAESGMASPDDVGAAASLGYSVALVGSALMKADDPKQVARAMRTAGAACL